jgi:class 3 adenylate cyclase/HAMP domain-containing protein
MGVRGRLLLAFLGISMFSLVAAASGLYSLSQVGSALNKITQQRVPEALSWLELSRRVESVVRAAPALLVVNTDSSRIAVSNEIAAQAEQLKPLLQRSRNYETDEEEAVAARVVQLVADMTENLVSLDELVKKRLLIVARKEKLIRELAKANSVAQRTLSPGARILGSQIAKWNRNRETDEAGQLSSKRSDLATSIIDLIPQQKAAVLVDAIHNNLLKISDADTAEGIDVMIFPLKKSLKELAEISEGMSKRAKKRIEKQIGIIEGLTAGPNSLPQVREDELAVIAQATDLLAENVRQSKFLTNRVSFLVNGANSEIENANLQAAAIQGLNRNILIGVVVLSLVSSFLIVWLYVGRNLITRLTALSDSMLAIAGGNLRAPLPAPGGGDEISRMAGALVVFRDTAIEVEESNLRDIEEARRRLVDAIENSSEGFAFYDPTDRLVICNNRYKELLYSGLDVAIEPGMAFEEIIRRSAESGLITDADGRIDEWVAERMAVHRDPGEPRIQQRGDGQWILITERKTGDGGTVAIYSDITDLKQREEDLTKKSNALEQLSNQLAKYLSPQVYDSIFSGKQEVKLVSQRKRLTVFFSDLVGFTATAERLESEDLTQLLNHYLTEMSAIAIAHGATIDKYVGDAIVIFFGDPETLGVKEDAIACVTMAIAMRKRMKELENVWLESGLEKPLQCRMGINTGVCTVGNFGSDDRMDYTIIGGGVNLAARLETACPANEILISYETYAHVRDLIECEEEAQIEVKGISHPVSTHRVVDLYENLGEGKQPIRAKMPHVRLDVDVNLMTASEQREAAAMLLEAAERLSNIDAKA